MNVGEKNKQECSGCTACSFVCTHNAITMEPDKLGFLYPHIDNEKCIDCGLCVKKCEFKEDYSVYDNFEAPIIYGGRLKDASALAASQSGGAAFAICECFIKYGGIVYGVVFDDNFHVIHTKVDKVEELAKLKGSKYVQSYLGDTFQQVRDNLMSNEKVLFVGTACQVAGLKSYIPQKYHTKLYTIDILCHACPSPNLWESYLQHIQKTNKGKIVTANMRNKKYGWRSFHETYQLSNGKEIKRESYIFLFFHHLSIKKSCEVCYFTNHRRVSDITLSDFWGWSKFHPEWNDDKGVSMIMVNSEKGTLLLNDINTVMSLIKSDESEIDHLQPQLSRPSKANPLRDSFEQDFSEKGFRYVSKKYGDENWKEQIKKIIRPFYLQLRNIRKK